MKERELKQLIQQQSDKIKELEADFNDEFTKGVLKTKEIEQLNQENKEILEQLTKDVLEYSILKQESERLAKEIDKLNRIINFIQRGMEGNEQFERVINDLKGGIE